MEIVNKNVRDIAGIFVLKLIFSIV